MKRALKPVLAMFLVILTLPLMLVKSSSNESIYLQDPIFGYINFMPDVMFESMYGGKYAPIKHPYLYLSSGKSVKCYEPATGKLVHTIPYDSSKESPWEATDEGVTFLSSGNGNKYCRLARFDSSELVIPLDDKVYYVSWGLKPLLVYQGYDNVTRFYTFEAKDIDGQTVWKIEKIRNFTRSSMRYFWVEISGKTNLIDMQTGEQTVTIPDGYSFVSSMGQFAVIRNNARVSKKEYATYSLETGKIIYESTNINFVYGDGEILYYSQVIEAVDNCYDFMRVSINGEIIEKKRAAIPFNAKTVKMNITSFYKNLTAININLGNKQRLALYDTSAEKIITQIDDTQSCKFIGDGLFYLGNTVAGFFDTLIQKNVWQTRIGNSIKPDVFTEKNFATFKLVGRQVQSSYKDSPYALQVKMINKADGSEEPIEFLFEYGKLENCFETDYGFVVINTTLITEHTNFPQISFYRKGSKDAVGSIADIGLISLNGIVIKDGRYLVVDLFGNKKVEIDCRTMTYRTK